MLLLLRSATFRRLHEDGAGLMISYMVFRYTAPCQGRPPAEHTARLSRVMYFGRYVSQMVGYEEEKHILLAVFASLLLVG